MNGAVRGSAAGGLSDARRGAKWSGALDGVRVECSGERSGTHTHNVAVNNSNSSTRENSCNVLVSAFLRVLGQNTTCIKLSFVIIVIFVYARVCVCVCVSKSKCCICNVYCTSQDRAVLYSETLVTWQAIWIQRFWKAQALAPRVSVPPKPFPVLGIIRKNAIHAGDIRLTPIQHFTLGTTWGHTHTHTHTHTRWTWGNVL